MSRSYVTRILRSLGIPMLVLSVIGMLVVAYFWRVFLPGAVLMPLEVLQNFAPWQVPGGSAPLYSEVLFDLIVYFLPWRHFAAEAVSQGNLPLWNPYIAAGVPAIANFQQGTFYPLNLLWYLLPDRLAINLGALLRVFLSGSFMYLFMRQLKVSLLAALSASVTYMFNGVAIVWLEWGVVADATLWLPLTLALIERAARRDFPLQDAAGIGLTLGIPLLGGHYQWTLYCIGTSGAYLLFRLLCRQKRPGYVRRTLGFFLLVGLLGIATAGIQLFPSIQFISRGHRGWYSYDEMIRTGVLPRLVQFVVPNFFGSPVARNWWLPTYLNYIETTVYVGLLPLLLGGIALFVRRDGVTTFFALLALLALLLALGTPLNRLVYAIPKLNSIPIHRHVYLIVLALCVLTGLTLDALPRLLGRQRRSMVTIIFLIGGSILLLTVCYMVVYQREIIAHWDYLRIQFALAFGFGAAALGLLLLFLLNYVPERLFLTAAGVLIVADLTVFGYAFNPISFEETLYPEPAVVRYLKGDSEPYRIVTLRKSAVLPPNLPLMFDLPAAQIYDPIIEGRYVNLFRAMGPSTAVYAERMLFLEGNADSALLDLLNVKYVLTTTDLWGNTEVSDAMQSQADSVVSLGTGGVAQEIKVGEVGLHRIDVVPTFDGTVHGELVLHVRTEFDAPWLIAHTSVDLADHPSGELVSLYISPTPSWAGRVFYLHFMFQGEGDVGLEASRDDSYADGDLWRDQHLLPGDLSFATSTVPRTNLVYQDEQAQVYLNEGYYPRAFVVHRAELAPDGEAALARLVDPSFDPQSAVVLEGTLPAEHALLADRPPNDEATAKIVDYQLNRVIIQTYSPAAGFLVLGDAYYPGWKAMVDGEVTPVYQADYLFRAVFVPPGTHQVQFYFQPESFMVGAVVSLAAVLVSVGLLTFCPGYHQRARRVREWMRRLRK